MNPPQPGGAPAVQHRHKHDFTLNEAGRLAAGITILPFAIAWWGSEILFEIVRDKVEPPIKRRYGKYRAKKLEEKKARQRLADTPQPLPAHRPRSLSTVPIQRANAQCQFLSILPLEIRQEIYKYVVGCNRVHIVRKSKHIAHVRCKCLDIETDFTRECRPGANGTYKGDSKIAFTSNGNVALLRSCRQIYVEAVEIMYSSNTFDFDHQDLFLLFARSILPQRLALIRNLQLCLGTANLDEAFLWTEPAVKGWGSMWQIIGNDMPALKHLHVRLLEQNVTLHPTLDDDWWVKSILQ
ncbi:MAG: hypothetical protein Q9184_001633, partial [Pyrenodesmia sp. 2 TL-2023]